MRSKYLLLAAGLLLMLSSTLALNAQSTPPDEATATPIQTPTPEVVNEILINYRIIYVLAEDVINPDHVVAPDKLQSDIRAIIAYDWESVLEAEMEAPLDVVIIHQSALPFVDYAWVRNAYESGIVISLIDIYYPELADVMGFNCGAAPTEPFYEENFFITYHFHVSSSPEGRLRVLEGLRNCEKLEDIKFGGWLGRGRSQESLEGEYGSLLFYGSLQSALMSVNQIEEHNLRATPPK